MNNPPVNSVKLPIIYEDAIRDLIACQTLDEAKYFADKAEALAAYARIHCDKRLAIESKRLKLIAFRRMGQLAEELFPARAKGRFSILIKSGLTRAGAADARRLSAAKDDTFRHALNSARPPSPAQFRRNTAGTSDSWKAFAGGATGTRHFMTFCRKHRARDVAIGIMPDEVDLARAIAIELSDWLDEFERNLRKGES